MDNFQLYRTNILLGGQMKWDLVLESDANDLYVKDFHLAPISDIVPYNYKKEENLLNYSHQENIKKYYKENSGYFYQNIIKPELENNWTNFDNNVHYNDITDMGCKRPKNYSVYKKQFEFFVPMWLEQVNKDLSFIISIYSKDDSLIASRSLILNNKTGLNYHNKFVKYFNDYLKYINIQNGNEDVINISLKSNYANITGLEVTSGNVVTKQDLNIINNLLIRERPLMENDNMITQLFKSNKLIAKQLFNFNLCFNIEDIISSVLRDQIYGGNFRIKVETKIGDIKLPIKDFYTNYEYIPKKSLTKTNATAPNVLSYLSDDKAIALIDKNKIKQNIIHWSLLGNNDYIFNLYDGFSSYIRKESQNINLTHLYDDTPDTNHYAYNEILNNLGWANYNMNFTSIDMRDLNLDFVKFENNYATKINFGWSNKLYFTHKEDNPYKISIYLGICTTNTLNNIVDPAKFYGDAGEKLEFVNIPNTRIFYLDYHDSKRHSNLILFLTDDINQLTYKSFSEILSGYATKNENENIIYLSKLLNSLKPLNVIVFNNSLSVKKTSSPNISQSKEIEYVKNNQCPINYVERYDGKIKPTFISRNNDINFNYFYFRGKNERFDKYNSSGYEPLYKSLNYFSIKHNEESDYNIPLYKERTYKEFKWFNDGNIIVLIPELILEFEIVYNENTEVKSLDDLIKEKIIDKFKSLYNTLDNNLIEYIYSFYNYKINFDYTIKHDEISGHDKPIYEYKYTINTILK